MFIKSVLVSFSILLSVGSIFSGENDSIRIINLSDSTITKKGLEKCKGFSCLVKGTDKTILFDVAQIGEAFLRNLDKLNIKPKDIDIIVLSHIHRDHIGSLKSFLTVNSDVTLYVPKSFMTRSEFTDVIKDFKTKTVYISEFQKICENVYSTGEMPSKDHEQSLIVKTQKGSILISGCSHPGIINIIKKAKSELKTEILYVYGGFHLRDMSEDDIKPIVDEFKTLNVKFVSPSHCTGETAEKMFENEFDKKFLKVGTGSITNINDLK